MSKRSRKVSVIQWTVVLGVLAGEAFALRWEIHLIMHMFGH